MGVYRKEEMKQTIINFLSSRTNLTIFQCVLYLMIGYIMGQHFSWSELGIVYVLLFGIQFVTRVKAVSDGMVFGHMMKKNNMKANEIVERMKKDVEKMDKDEWN